MHAIATNTHLRFGIDLSDLVLEAPFRRQSTRFLAVFGNAQIRPMPLRR